jgi:beta-lactamase class A
MRMRIAAALLVLLAGCSPTTETETPASPARSVSPAPGKLNAKPLEDQYDARLGIYALDTGTGETVEYRADERFAYASTLKALAAGVVLDKVKVTGLKKRITYARKDIVSNSPVTEKHVEDGMTLGDVMEAAITVSDNTALNLMVRELGGPDVLEKELRAEGDDTIEVDRLEPDLNTAVPGDKRDTSTPRAMAATLRAYTLGKALEGPERDQLVGWLKANTTGDELIRASVPDGWTVGDKTGAGGYGSRNDIAVLWPANGAPIVMAIMSTKDEPDAVRNDKLIADAAALVIPELRR